MANDNRDEDLGLDEAPKGGRTQTPMMILLVVVCLLMAANLFFTLKKSQAPPAAAEGGTPPEPAEVFTFDMEEPVRKQTKDGIVLARLQVEFRSEEALAILEAEEGKGKFDDIIMSTFLGKSGDDIKDVDTLKEEITTALEEIVGEEQIVRINFRDLIYQEIPSRSKDR